MPKEIERKFLVFPDAFHKAHDGKLPAGSSLEQGYFSKHPTVRIRISETQAWLTIKGKGALVRDEYEYEIPHADGREIVQLCKITLKKVRYEIPFAGMLWEVDQFLGPLAGLWVAEVELEDPDQHFELPPWVADEVTDDKRYTNAYLVEHGLPV